MPRVLALLLLVAATLPAAAEPVATRYAFVPVESGVLRLDTASGEIFLCTVPGAGAYACNRLAGGAEPGSRDLLRLQAEVEALKAEVAGLPERGTEDAPAGNALSRIATLADRVVSHFLGAVADLKREFRKTRL